MKHDALLIHSRRRSQMQKERERVGEVALLLLLHRKKVIGNSVLKFIEFQISEQLFIYTCAQVKQLLLGDLKYCQLSQLKHII